MGDHDMTEELFTVWTWFEDGSYEPDGPPVPGEAAIKRAFGITQSVGARMGVVKEIRVVDRGDETCFHWKDGVILFPTPEDIEKAKG